MDDTILLFTGVSVFSLMLIAIILTVLEFRGMDERPEKYVARKPRRPEDRD